MTITLNGEPFELQAPTTISGLLTHLDIDSRRVAIEHNLVIVRRALYDTTAVNDEIGSGRPLHTTAPRTTCDQRSKPGHRGSRRSGHPAAW